VLTGGSGSGKSLLLRMLADLDEHDGEAFLEGHPCSQCTAPAWRRQVTYVAPESGWWASTVRAHFPDDTDFSALLPALGLPAAAADWLVARLSTGERQRLALARALRPTTRVLLLDEPTSGLDPANVERVEQWLREALKRGLGILLVTHDPAQASRLGARRLLLDAGHVRESP
jgi:phosphate-transporting ATPase